MVKTNNFEEALTALLNVVHCIDYLKRGVYILWLHPEKPSSGHDVIPSHGGHYRANLTKL